MTVLFIDSNGNQQRIGESNEIIELLAKIRQDMRKKLMKTKELSLSLEKDDYDRYAVKDVNNNMTGYYITSE